MNDPYGTVSGTKVAFVLRLLASFDIEAVTIELSRLLRFGAVGIFATIVYPVVTLGVVSIGANAILATSIGHIAAGVVSYLGHLRYSFRVAPDHGFYLRRFFVAAAAMFAGNLAITWLFISVLGLSSVVSVAVVGVLIPIVNYLCSRFWVFRPGLEPSTGNRGNRE